MYFICVSCFFFFSKGLSLRPAVPSWQVWRRLQQGLLLSQRRHVRPRHRAVPVWCWLQRTQVHSRHTHTAKALLATRYSILKKYSVQTFLKTGQTMAWFIDIAVYYKGIASHRHQLLIVLFSLLTPKWGSNLAASVKEQGKAWVISHAGEITIYKCPLVHLKVHWKLLIEVFMFN